MGKLDHTSGGAIGGVAFGVLVLVLVLNESGALARIGLMGPMGLMGAAGKRATFIKL